MSEYRGQKPRRAARAAFVACPFCHYRGISTTNPGRWCAGFFTRYTVGDKWVTFDPNMAARSMGEAWAVAIAKSGGMKLGSA